MLLSHSPTALGPKRTHVPMRKDGIRRCDGKRNLAEVIQNTEMELGPQNNFDWVGYFKFLQRHGYVDFVQQ